jgi:hypothetical protein
LGFSPSSSFLGVKQNFELGKMGKKSRKPPTAEVPEKATTKAPAAEPLEGEVLTVSHILLCYVDSGLFYKTTSLQSSVAPY